MADWLCGGRLQRTTETVENARLTRRSSRSEHLASSRGDFDEEIEVTEWGNDGGSNVIVRRSPDGTREVRTELARNGRGDVLSEHTEIVDSTFVAGFRTVAVQTTSAPEAWRVAGVEVRDSTGAVLHRPFASASWDDLGRPTGFSLPGAARDFVVEWDGPRIARTSIALPSDSSAIFATSREFDDAGRVRRFASLGASGATHDERLRYTIGGALAGRFTGTADGGDPIINGDVELWEYTGLGRLRGERRHTAVAVADATAQLAEAPTRRGGIRSVAAFGEGTHHTHQRSALGTLLNELVDGDTAYTALPASDGASLAEVAETVVKWSPTGELNHWVYAEHGIAASGWSADGLPARVEAIDELGTVLGTEDRLYDALGRVVAVRTSTPNGGTSISHRIWWGNTLVSEEWNNGWRRDWYPGLGIDAPLGYTVNCSGGDCAKPPLGVDIEGASLSASSPQATYFYAQDLGRDMVMLVDIHGVAVERYRYETYGHRTITEPGAGDICNDADDRTCQSRFGNPLGHAGAMRSPITGVYEMRARLYAPAMRVFLSTDPLGYVDAFDRWLYVGGDPVNFWDPFGLGKGGVYVDPCDDPSSLDCTMNYRGDILLGNEPSVSREELDADVTFVDEFMCGLATGSKCDLEGWWVFGGDIAGTLLAYGAFRDGAIAIHSGDPKTIAIEAASAAAGPAGGLAADGLRAITRIVGGVGDEIADTVAGVVSREAGDVVDAPVVLPPLRVEYVDAVRGLAAHADALRQSGATAEEIARTLHAERNALKLQFRSLSPPESVAMFEQRNIDRYGDPLGPSIEQLRERGKTWEEIIESATRPGGADLGF